MITTRAKVKLDELIAETPISTNELMLAKFAEDVIRMTIEEITSGYGTMNKKADHANQIKAQALYEFFGE